MTNRILRAALTLSVAFYSHAAFGAVILFNNGVNNTINDATFDMDAIEIEDAGGGTATTVTLDAPGDIGESVTVRDTSVFNMTGGTVGTRVEGEGSSTVNISGGQIGDQVSGVDNAVINIFDGIIGSEDSFFDDDATLFMSGGVIEEISFNGNAQGLVTGGGVEAIFTNDDAFVQFFGDSVLNDVVARDVSNIQLFGGNLVSEDLRSEDTAVIDIFGSVFNFPFGPIAAAMGMLTGTLADGGTIGMDFSRDPDAQIILHQLNTVPEPGTAVLLVLGAAGLGLRARRRASHGRSPWLGGRLRVGPAVPRSVVSREGR